jgi:hypothetical protein
MKAGLPGGRSSPPITTPRSRWLSLSRNAAAMQPTAPSRPHQQRDRPRRGLLLTQGTHVRPASGEERDVPSRMARALPLPQNGYRPLRAHRPLVVVAEPVDGSALGTLVTNARDGTFHSVAVRAPGFGHRRLDNLQDIASLTATQVITNDGEEARSTTNERLGRARKLIVTPAEPLATGCRGTPAPPALAGDRPQSSGG